MHIAARNGYRVSIELLFAVFAACLYLSLLASGVKGWL